MTPAPSPAARKVASAENEVRGQIAPLWRRGVAFGIDASILGGFFIFYLWIAAALGRDMPESSPLAGLDALMIWAHALQTALVPGLVLLAALAFGYATACGCLWNGRTVGRHAMGLRLVDETGGPPLLARAAARAGLALASFLIFFGGFWLSLFDRRGQTFHDKLTSTFVILPG
jgi:uncharacterized RDD family membrane protein YckC